MIGSFIRWVVRWIVRIVFVLALLTLGLLGPVGYVEFACQPEGAAEPYAAILPPEHHRPESRTYLTYPEWHIVHAYDDYAEVIAEGDPHDYGFLRSISGFWTSLCDVARSSGPHGGVTDSTKSMVYVIGVSFTAELLAKAAYEETLGRIATLVRGTERAPLDDLTAEQARGYAEFLQQVPWYRWDFTGAARALDAAATGAPRDRERRLALGLEYRAKALYADAIAAAVKGTGADALTLRMIIDRAPAASEGITVIARRPEGVEIETPRYRALTGLLVEMAANGVNVVEIAGNDDIMLTVLSEDARLEGAQASMARQGNGDYRHLVDVKVTDLAERLRSFERDGLRVEHVHDY